MAFRKKAKKAPETFHFEERERPMEWAEGMRNLTQEIANSFDARVARVAALREETAEKLTGFRQEMKNLQHQLKRKAADLKRFLRNAESSRLRDFRTMHQGIRAGQEARSRQLGGMLSGCREMLSGFRREHEAAVDHWLRMTGVLARSRTSTVR